MWHEMPRKFNSDAGTACMNSPRWKYWQDSTIKCLKRTIRDFLWKFRIFSLVLRRGHWAGNSNVMMGELLGNISYYVSLGIRPKLTVRVICYKSVVNSSKSTGAVVGLPFVLPNWKDSREKCKCYCALSDFMSNARRIASRFYSISLSIFAGSLLFLSSFLDIHLQLIDAKSILLYVPTLRRCLTSSRASVKYLHASCHILIAIFGWLIFRLRVTNIRSIC